MDFLDSHLFFLNIVAEIKGMYMKENVWILNHYASTAFVQRGERHYWMAKELLKRGYNPVVFCANTIHNTEDAIEVENDYCVKEQDGITFVIVKTPSYSGNGISRIRNMYGFYRKVKHVMEKFIKAGAPKPDIILASHVHPLTCVAGLQSARKYGVPCIVEIRDLWPAALIAAGSMSEKSFIAQMLYKLERYLYTKAQAVIFTMEGGKEYIQDKKWDKGNGGPVDLEKVFYINNGVDIEGFEKNVMDYPMKDDDLDDPSKFCVVYTGSVRRINQIDTLLDIAKELEDEPAIQILIWGAGDHVDQIKERIQKEHISNVKYKGVVSKQQVPWLIRNSDVNIIHWMNMDILKYGCSYNKLFEYLAAGNPIYSTIHIGYSIIKNNDCGIEAEGHAPQDFAQDIKLMYRTTQEQRDSWGMNARETAKQFDFSVLTEKLITVMENL